MHTVSFRKPGSPQNPIIDLSHASPLHHPWSATLNPARRVGSNEVKMSQSAEWSLASRIIGAALLVAAPTVLVLAAEIWAHADRTPHIIVFHAWLARIGVLTALLACIATIGMAIKGERLASRDGQISGLARGALIVSGASFVAWVIASVGLLNTTESLLRQF